MSPMTRATADSMRVAGAGTLSLHGAGEVTRPSKPRMRNCPQRVGKSASATFFTLSSGIVSLYVWCFMGDWIVLGRGSMQPFFMANDNAFAYLLAGKLEEQGTIPWRWG